MINPIGQVFQSVKVSVPIVDQHEDPKLTNTAGPLHVWRELALIW
jgi:hypothetical protein